MHAKFLFNKFAGKMRFLPKCLAFEYNFYFFQSPYVMAEWPTPSLVLHLFCFLLLNEQSVFTD